MGSGHADFSDEIVKALKSSPLPMFKHFPPNVPLVSSPTTKTLSQHLSWLKQTRSEKNISNNIVAALKEPSSVDQSTRKGGSQGKSYKLSTIAPYQGSLILTTRSEAKRKYSKRRRDGSSNGQKESYQKTYVTTVRTEKPKKRWKKKRKSSGGEIFANEKTFPKLHQDSRPVKSLSDVEASEIVRELKSKRNSNETKKAPVVSGWMKVDPFKIGPASKADTFKIDSKKVDTHVEVVATNQIDPF